MEVSSCRQGLCYLLFALTHLFAHQVAFSKLWNGWNRRTQWRFEYLVAFIF
uniref:Uncharacterized protein n=1 Tax=Helianthus annuus TaxID=4232 RepID=A0A251VM92_HELAN